ncbi:hypothetical protein [Streptomyces sp. NBC_01320]|uniref:hypothetical protein n=1 Tax=Streptomyces sp. NBC_01320 TaxID=2903824 RepID=UPI002E137002|nr:hypothetical protein OG395_01040 [Streptomyces sp. NBC_01320]WSK01051.1 hypothetical protein OG395_54315 [Streptomyces sp. NBC_01320]
MPERYGGWAAATLVLAQSEALGQPQYAVQRALHVLDHVPAARLRSTTRTRLHKLATALPAGHAADLTERLGTLPVAIDHHGHAL